MHRIVSDPEIPGGKPVVESIRLSVELTGISDLTEAQIAVCLDAEKEL